MDQDSTSAGAGPATPPAHADRAPAGGGASHTHAPERGLEHGVPSEAGEAEPMGLPTSDRHHAETAAAKSGGNDAAAKHVHQVPERPD